jgi:photosystem II stability/assembly factor-like uncharacterized protein
VTVCISPNGRTMYSEDAPARQLMVATLDGITVLEREGPRADWHVARRTLEGLHISAIHLEPMRGALFAGVHGHGLYRSTDGGYTWEEKTRGLTPDHTYTINSTNRDGAPLLWAGTEPSHLFRSADYGETWEELPSLLGVPDTDKWTFPAPPHTGHVKNVAFDPRDKHTLYVGIEQGGLFKSVDDGQTWRELDDYSRPDDRAYKDVHRIVIHPTNPDVMYITSGEGLYGSADAGETWEHLSGRDARIGYPDALVISPRNPNVMYMGGANQSPGVWRTSHEARSTIMRSEDGGRTWEIAGSGLPDYMRANMEAMSLLEWPGGLSLYAGNTDGDVFASEDEGASWACIASGLAPVSKVGHYHALR